MPDKLIRSPVAWSAVFLALVYWFFASIMPVDILVPLLNGIFVGVTLALFVAYWRLGWATIRLSRQEYRRADQFAIGIELMWAAIFINRSYAVYLRVIGQAHGFTDNHWVGVFVYMWIVAGFLQVTAPGLYEGLDVGKDKWTLYITTVLGALLAGVLVLAQGWGSGSLPEIRIP